MSLSAALPARARFRITTVAVVALVAGLLSVVSASPASAVDTSISGNVKTAGSPDANLSGASVTVFTAAGSDVAYGSTDASGNFTIGGLSGGSYTLRFTPGFDSSYLTQYYGGADSLATATYFTVETGQAVTGKDIVLQLGATVSGNIKNSANANLSGVIVIMNGPDWSGGQYAMSDASGNYTFHGIPAGQHTLQFNPGSAYAPEWWNDKTSFATADFFAVAPQATLTGLNVVLANGATISGNVKGAGSPNVNLAGFTVTAYRDGAFAKSFTDSIFSSTGDGNYSIGGLVAGSYTLRFESASESNYATEYWVDKLNLSSADTFTVGVGATVTGKNAVLAQGSTITGTITDNAGGAVYGFPVVYRTGAAADVNTFVRSVWPSEDGTYSVNKLPVGTYKIGFTTDSSGYANDWGLAPSYGYNSEWYSNASSYASASTVTITAPGQLISNINGSLQKLTFEDVGDTASPFFTPIEWMFSAGISTGTPQADSWRLPLYKPLTSVSRQAMAKFLYELSGDTFTPPTEPTFSDVDATNAFNTAIEWMYAEGISTGTPVDGAKPLYNPAAPVSRQAMATFLSRYKGITLGTPTAQSFADVPISASTAGAIEWMKSAGISTGTPQPSGLPLYKPADPVSRQAMAAFLYRMEHPAA